MTNPIDSFVDVASTYCSLIEEHDQYAAEIFITRVREILPLLYHHALALPEVETIEGNVNGAISHDEWAAMYARLQSKLGVNDSYWEIFDPLKTEHDEPVAASLSDDLSDIWRDLKDGLSQWPRCSATMRQQILWNWYFSFHNHWSHHLVDALRAINWVVEHYGIRRSQNDA